MNDAQGGSVRGVVRTECHRTDVEDRVATRHHFLGSADSLAVLRLCITARLRIQSVHDMGFLATGKPMETFCDQNVA